MDECDRREHIRSEFMRVAVREYVEAVERGDDVAASGWIGVAARLEGVEPQEARA